ncbi:AAA domain-containing protein, putative AbiEii toxin, Type IV TA system [Anaerovibrio lipolyticus DSM 3074]|uniref:AAA domain-containing protein, putative AbiEii toxin, Type IV TA system n=2 Tax=Anaerovibrio lipolyticus TaxID=82374 RepID=A0A1M6EDM5_9FIRM|nr:AAA domain-containing protein, putative AbiEii toxin, Type IV TA system [Anaerovibrio lipolyticus DSM 3074]
MGVSNLKIKKFGPIKEADIDVKDFLVLTGPQAAGKSIVAKLVYYFTSLKEIVYAKQLLNYPQHPYKLKQQVIDNMKTKMFLMFGDDYFIADTEIAFTYENCESVRLVYCNNGHFSVEFSTRINNYLHIHDKEFTAPGTHDINVKDKWKNELNEVFGAFIAVYIPAGRSMTSSLGKYFYYWYAMMDDEQKNMLDYSIKGYIEEIMRIDPLLDKGIVGLHNKYRDKLPALLERLATIMLNNAHDLIKGKYYFRSGVEKLQLDSGEEIDMQQASSGQQEVVGIVNILMYYVVTQRNVLFIIEEPEAHLFPDGQRLITRLMAIAHNAGNKVIFTTHSPYILGEVNNLFYAHYLYKKGLLDLNNILISDYGVSEHNLLAIDKSTAYFVKDGIAEMCINEESLMIDQDKIDGASIMINGLFDVMVELERKNGED